MLIDQQQNSVNNDVYAEDRLYSDIQFSTEEGEHKSNYVTAGAGVEVGNFVVKSTRPVIQPRSSILPW
jgi:hypothetical protein